MTFSSRLFNCSCNSFTGTYALDKNDFFAYVFVCLFV